MVAIEHCIYRQARCDNLQNVTEFHKAVMRLWFRYQGSFKFRYFLALWCRFRLHVFLNKIFYASYSPLMKPSTGAISALERAFVKFKTNSDSHSVYTVVTWLVVCLPDILAQSFFLFAKFYLEQVAEQLLTYCCSYKINGSDAKTNLHRLQHRQLFFPLTHLHTYTFTVLFPV